MSGTTPPRRASSKQTRWPPDWKPKRVSSARPAAKSTWRRNDLLVLRWWPGVRGGGATLAIATQGLTYDHYMAEPEIRKRYDIIDGVRIFMTNPTIAHQELQGNLYTALRAWNQASRAGKVILAPCDVLIRRSPLRTRQP